MDRVDTLVIGAGVVGLAVARALAQAGHEVVVLERAAAIGTGVSSRNSEVIHAGLYYPTGSLKAQLCVRGKTLLYDYCGQRQVAFRRCGKLVVATQADERDALQTVAQKAEANGVEVEWVTEAQAREMEPALRCHAALWSRSTGIIDSHGLMLSLQGDLEDAGGSVALLSAFDHAQPEAGGWRVSVRLLQDGSTLEMGCRQLINASGLEAPDVARRIQGLDHRTLPHARYAKGHYFSLSGRAPFSRLIYPVPRPASLGTHLTLDLGGQAKFGPDIEWLSVQDAQDIDYTVDPARSDDFYADVRRYWPGLPDGALQPAYSGVRPKIHGPDEPAADFRIDGPETHGFAGLVNLMGIESPGLTSALAIGEQVKRLLRAS